MLSNNVTTPIRYFSLIDYVNKIKISENVLLHLQDTEEEFNNYLKVLKKYDDKFISNYWIYLLYEAIKTSKTIENHDSDIIKDLPHDLLCDTTLITNDKIHKIHHYCLQEQNKDGLKYRNIDVNVSSYLSNGQEKIFFKGVDKRDVNVFMDDFIKLYNYIENDKIENSPFLKSSLLHLLFVRMQPYSDGNKRTARIIQNLKFASSLEKYNDINLKLSPINISRSIKINQISYSNILNNLNFDNIHNDNEVINKWFDFMLNMADEQIYLSLEKTKKIDKEFLKEINKNNKENNRVKVLTR